MGPGLRDTLEMVQTGAASHASESFTMIVTGSSFLLGGLRTPGAATTELMTGGTSVTVTDVAHEFWFPDPSVAVQVTGVVPNPNDEPEVGTQLALTAGQLSLKVGVTPTDAPPELVQLTVVGAGHVMLGS